MDPTQGAPLVEPEDRADAADTVIDEADTLGSSLETVEAESDAEPSAGHGADEGGANDAEEADDGEGRGRRRLILRVALALGAVAVAGGVVLAAGSLGGDGGLDPLPAQVGDASVVISQLEAGGIDCRSAAVVGDVATCTSTITVRIWPDAKTADAWVTKTVSAPTTSSAIGWVQHGNVVVAGPLGRAPEFAAILGPDSRIA